MQALTTLLRHPGLPLPEGINVQIQIPVLVQRIHRQIQVCVNQQHRSLL